MRSALSAIVSTAPRRLPQAPVSKWPEEDGCLASLQSPDSREPSSELREKARPARRTMSCVLCACPAAWPGVHVNVLQCSNLTGITSPDNQTRSWLTSQNNQKVVLTGIQYHFGPGAETGPDRPSRALEPSDRHLHTPKQPFHFKYHLFSCRIRPSPAVSGRFRPYSYVFQSIGAVRCRGSRLNTAPLELKRIKLESDIRKYQLTIPLSKSIKEWSIPL